MKPYKFPQRIPAKTWLGISIGLAVTWLFSCSIQDSSLTTVEILSPTAEKCGGCHVDIFNEWKSSKHASINWKNTWRWET